MENDELTLEKIEDTLKEILKENPIPKFHPSVEKEVYSYLKEHIIMNKICTSLEQSKKLIELEIDVNTADMQWVNTGYCMRVLPTDDYEAQSSSSKIPAWSLSALMRLMPKVGHSFPELCRGKETGLFYMWLDEEFDTQKYSNPIDAAFEMVVWLKENGKI